MRIGEVAARAEVNVQTLRYYERRGLLREPRRTISGYRAYPADAVHVVRFIKRAQELGFRLAEIEVLLRLADGGPDSCAQVRGLAVEKVGELDTKIGTLLALRDGLQRLIETCDRPRDERECPILHTLDDGRDHRAARDVIIE